METKFKVGDFVRLDHGRIGEITSIPSEGCYFINGYLLCTDAHLKEKVDIKTAFLTELKELMEKYGAIISGQDVFERSDINTKEKCYPQVNIRIGSEIISFYEGDGVSDAIITLSNIFDYDK